MCLVYIYFKIDLQSMDCSNFLNRIKTRNKQSFVVCETNEQNACSHVDMTPNSSSSAKSHKSRADPIKVIIMPDTYEGLLKNIYSVNKQCFIKVFLGV